ncbi:hypothetical protein LINPERHAP1_LOCUS35813 [Linum perenne]
MEITLLVKEMEWKALERNDDSSSYYPVPAMSMKKNWVT